MSKNNAAAQAGYTAVWRAKNREKYLQQARESSRRYRDKNPEKSRQQWRESARRHRAKNLEAHRAYQRFRNRQRIEELASRKRPDNCEISGLAGSVHYDHCHECGEFRGWIHGKLNRALGLVGDNPKLLRDLADYLEKHEKTCPKRG